MAVILYRFADGHTEEIEVTDEFAAEYAAMEHRDKLSERKETRRHQSLDKSMEHGFDVPDPRVDIQAETERRELSGQLKTALHTLTDKQRAVFLRYASDGLSFREIGEEMSIGRYTVRDYYYNAVKKLKIFFSTIPPNSNSRGY